MRKRLLTLVFAIFSITAFSATNIYAPTLAAPGNGAAGQQVSLLLDWNAVPGAMQYKIEYSTDSTFTTSFQLYSTSTATTINNLLFGTEYSWRVKALGATDSSAWSDVFTFTTLDAVTIIRPYENASNCYVTLGLQWTAIAGVTLYNFEADSAATFDSPLYQAQSFAGSDIKGFTTPLNFGTHYYIRMRAINSVDTSGWSDLRQFITTDTIIMKKPQNDTLNAAPGIMMVWKYNGALNYEVSFATDSAFTTENIFSVDSSAIERGSIDTLVYNSEILDYNTYYYYRVRGVTSWGPSKWSAVRNLTTTGCIGLSLPADGATAVSTLPRFAWKLVAGTDRYEIQVDTSALFTNPQNYYTLDTAVHYALVNELLPQTDYFWRVRGISATDTSGWCTERTFKTYWGIGINQVQSTVNNINIYPNPTKNGFVFVQLNSGTGQEVTIVVSNLFGQDIYNENHLLEAGLNSIKLDLGNSANGIYLIKVIHAGNTVTRKIILDK